MACASFRECVEHRFNNARLRNIRQQDREFVAPKARHAVGVGGRGRRLRARGQLRVAEPIDGGRTPCDGPARSAARATYRFRARTIEPLCHLAQQLIADLMASVSLICLKRSRSMNKTPTAVPLVRARSSAEPTDRERSGEFGNPSDCRNLQAAEFDLPHVALGDVLHDTVYGDSAASSSR